MGVNEMGVKMAAKKYVTYTSRTSFTDRAAVGVVRAEATTVFGIGTTGLQKFEYSVDPSAPTFIRLAVMDFYDQEGELSDEISVDARERVATVRDAKLDNDFGLFVKENGNPAAGIGVDVSPRGVNASGRAVNDPTWSPNGRYIAYTHMNAGQARVWLAGPDFSQPAVDITGPAGRYGWFYIQWSPDSRYVYFRTSESSTGTLDLYRHDVSTGIGAVIIPGDGQKWVHNVRVTPDGKKIVYVADLDTDGVNELWVANADGTSPVKRQAGDAANMIANNGNDFSLSPDGAKAMYRLLDVASGKNELVTVSLEGSSPPTLIGPPFDISVNAAHYSPDGTDIAFLGVAPSSFQKLYLYSSSGPVEISTQLSPAANISAVDTMYWSPSGDEIAFRVQMPAPAPLTGTGYRYYRGAPTGLKTVVGGTTTAPAWPGAASGAGAANTWPAMAAYSPSESFFAMPADKEVDEMYDVYLFRGTNEFKLTTYAELPTNTASVAWQTRNELAIAPYCFGYNLGYGN